jgi:ribose transport system permease protein
MSAEVSEIRPETAGRRFTRVGQRMALDRFSGLYVAIALVVVFSLIEPATFATARNVRVIATNEAITGILTLGLMVALLAGMFDVSVAATMSLAISLVGWLQSAHHVNAALAVVLTLLCGAVVGLVNAFIVTVLGVQPIIATLGTSSVLSALTFWIAGGNDIITGISTTFSDLGSGSVVSIPLPVIYLAGVALLLFYLLEHTAFGRYLYGAGFNARAIRLAGVQVVRYQVAALVIAGVAASFAGILLTMEVGSASYGAGTPYLLPAFAVAFLGSTQFRPGRFNVVGSLVALYLLAIGVQGLELRYPSLPWIADLFEGLALIFAVAVGVRARRAPGGIRQ